MSCQPVMTPAEYQQEGLVLSQRAAGKGCSRLWNVACSCRHRPTLEDTLSISFSFGEVGAGGVLVEYG